ncbi:hypothetical protein L1887_34769 [Cichorium endivia]|nr:hypothetical protein L1887_34769 [Cichorium endivia]
MCIWTLTMLMLVYDGVLCEVFVDDDGRVLKLGVEGEIDYSIVGKHVFHEGSDEDGIPEHPSEEEGALEEVIDGKDEGIEGGDGLGYVLNDEGDEFTHLAKSKKKAF